MKIKLKEVNTELVDNDSDTPVSINSLMTDSEFDEKHEDDSSSNSVSDKSAKSTVKEK